MFRFSSRLTLLALGGALFIGMSSPKDPGKGIQFFQGGWDEAKAAAKAEGKLIFMDAYAVWCGPCKFLKSNVFTDPAVGEYFNKHFINLEMDMEKGEGRGLSRQFQVNAYPTLIFMRNDGSVVRKSVGYMSAEQLLALAHEAEGLKAQP